MTSKVIKRPGPEHPITIARNPTRVVVTVAGHVVADSREALTLREATYGAVQYIPRKDVDMSRLERTDHATYCPYKGECAYYSIPSGGEGSVNAVWTYEHPCTTTLLSSPGMSRSTRRASTPSRNARTPGSGGGCAPALGRKTLSPRVYGHIQGGNTMVPPMPCGTGSSCVSARSQPASFRKHGMICAQALFTSGGTRQSVLRTLAPRASPRRGDPEGKRRM